MAYTFADNVLGCVNVTDVITIAPGVANLPGVVLEEQLGEIRKATDGTYGAGQFIFLKIPASTTLSLGNLVTWTAGYSVATLPVLSTSKNTLSPIAIAPVAVASSTSVQYGWFQIQGRGLALKTAVTVSPNSVIYASGTAGRFKVLTSAGGQILGARTANSATVTSTTSTVVLYINNPSMQGQIT
jgi:hypothetical protein